MEHIKLQFFIASLVRHGLYWIELKFIFNNNNYYIINTVHTIQIVEKNEYNE